MTGQSSNSDVSLEVLAFCGTRYLSLTVLLEHEDIFRHTTVTQPSVKASSMCTRRPDYASTTYSSPPPGSLWKTICEEQKNQHSSKPPRICTTIRLTFPLLRKLFAVLRVSSMKCMYVTFPFSMSTLAHTANGESVTFPRDLERYLKRPKMATCSVLSVESETLGPPNVA